MKRGPWPPMRHLARSERLTCKRSATSSISNSPGIALADRAGSNCSSLIRCRLLPMSLDVGEDSQAEYAAGTSGNVVCVDFW
jgi:hypothetical protein